MSIVITTVARIRDWGPPLGARRERLGSCALRAGASQCLLLRNVHDASQALLLIELPDHDALRLLMMDAAEETDDFYGECLARCRVWEPAARSEPSR